MKLPKTALAACLIRIQSGTENSAIQLFPAGEFNPPLGSMLGTGPWRMDATAAASLIALVANRANDIVIDYEHQSLVACTEGNPAPAAGWLKTDSLAWQDDGLYAQSPSWTAKAAAMIDADEYRYISPVFTYDKATGVPLNIISVALTNTPAIDGMAAVSLAAATAKLNQEDSVMDPSELMERLCYLLNLPVTTTVAEMSAELDKVKAILDGGGTDMAAAGLVAYLMQSATQIAALKSATPDPAKYVPIEALLAIQGHAALNDAVATEQKIAALIAANPLVIFPALEPWAKELGKQDITALEKFIVNAAPIAALTANQSQHTPPPPSVPNLTTEELAVCSRLGLGQEQFIKTREGK
jgi:phage I-like protein